MKKHTPKKRVGPRTSFGILAVSTIAAFVVGVQSADEGSVVHPIVAGSDVILGDLDGSGKITEKDAELAVEIAAGLKKATPEELRADPTENGVITASDALWILDHIGKR